jgi:hypothetical protein
MPFYPRRGQEQSKVEEELIQYAGTTRFSAFFPTIQPAMNTQRTAIKYAWSRWITLYCKRMIARGLMFRPLQLQTIFRNGGRINVATLAFDDLRLDFGRELMDRRQRAGSSRG